MSSSPGPHTTRLGSFHSRSSSRASRPNLETPPLRHPRPSGIQDHEARKPQPCELATRRGLGRLGNGKGKQPLVRLDVESAQEAEVPIDDVRRLSVRGHAFRVEKRCRPFLQVARAEPDAAVASREKGRDRRLHRALEVEDEIVAALADFPNRFADLPPRSRREESSSPPERVDLEKRVDVGVVQKNVSMPALDEPVDAGLGKPLPGYRWRRTRSPMELWRTTRKPVPFEVNLDGN
jgi:hypothetical protein